MANLKNRYYSNCLCRHTTFQMYLPNGFRAEKPNEMNAYVQKCIPIMFG